MVNLGNLEYAKGNLDVAIEYFEGARDSNPRSPSPYVGLAQSHFDLRNPAEVRSNYQALRDLSPRIAERFSYLIENIETSSRASDSLETILLWAEDEDVDE